jgi:hypothetical protein
VRQIVRRPDRGGAISSLLERGPYESTARALLVALAVSAFAQSPTIRGTVTDTSGAVISGATVTIRNAQTSESRKHAV